MGEVESENIPSVMLLQSEGGSLAHNNIIHFDKVCVESVHTRSPDNWATYSNALRYPSNWPNMLESVKASKELARAGL
jgi:hypothetical protein